MNKSKRLFQTYDDWYKFSIIFNKAFNSFNGVSEWISRKANYKILSSDNSILNGELYFWDFMYNFKRKKLNAIF